MRRRVMVVLGVTLGPKGIGREPAKKTSKS